MIQIHYRPLTGLKPLHLALMGVMEVSGGPDDFESRLSLPRMMVEHAIDDLVSWKLAELNSYQVVLSPKGKRSLSVWEATDKKGYWQCKRAGTWLLGKGRFFFRSPLTLLSDAGLDPETGEVLSASDSKEILKSYHRNRTEIDKRISDKRIAERLREAIQKNADLTEIVSEEFSTAVTILQLNQMSKMAFKSLKDALEGNRDSSQPLGNEVIRKSMEQLEDVKIGRTRLIKDGQSTLQTAERVLLV